MSFSSHWCLDPSVTYLNHGSYGACPAAVLAAQSALRLEMEREPVDFLSMTLPARFDAARDVLAAFVGADPADMVFVANATASPYEQVDDDASVADNMPKMPGLHSTIDMRVYYLSVRPLPGLEQREM